MALSLIGTHWSGLDFLQALVDSLAVGRRAQSP